MDERQRIISEAVQEEARGALPEEAEVDLWPSVHRRARSQDHGTNRADRAGAVAALVALAVMALVVWLGLRQIAPDLLADGPFDQPGFRAGPAATALDPTPVPDELRRELTREYSQAIAPILEDWTEVSELALDRSQPDWMDRIGELHAVRTRFVQLEVHPIFEEPHAQMTLHMDCQIAAQYALVRVEDYAQIGVPVAPETIFDRCRFPTDGVSDSADPANRSLQATEAPVPTTTLLERLLGFAGQDTPEITTYTVQPGDNLFEIADRFDLQPETVLWANADVLQDDPHRLRAGQELRILPVDGVYHRWEAGHDFRAMAAAYGVDPIHIIQYPGNRLDPDSFNPDAPELPDGYPLVVPGGRREMAE